MKEKILLVGGGGHCCSCIDVIEQQGKYEIAGIIDQKDKIGSLLMGYEILGTDDDISRLVSVYKNALITLGQIKSASPRINIFSKLKKANANLPIIISPRAYVSKHAIIGSGTIVMHDVIVNAKSVIGINCILNSKSLCEHEVSVGDFCHISTGAVLNGEVEVGSECFVGSNSVLRQRSKIVSKTIIPFGEKL